jgi:hypothetical protein
MGEKENPWMRLGQGGSFSGLFRIAQQLIKIAATAIQIRILDFLIDA